MYSMIDRAAGALATALAIAGGFVLLVIIVLTCISVIGRALVPLDLGIGSIRGIYDMTEIGMAAAIFSFLPWAQYTDAHARVDLFAPILAGPLDRGLALLFDLGMLLVACVGTWRLSLGMMDKMRFGETTLIAQIPVWQGYALGLLGAVGFVLVALFCVLRTARRMIGFAQ